MKKRTFKTSALLVVLSFATAAEAQVSYDFQAVTPQGDTLLYR